MPLNRNRLSRQILTQYEEEVKVEEGGQTIFCVSNIDIDLKNEGQSERYQWSIAQEQESLIHD